MRIAVVTTTFLPNVGGAEFAVHHLARQWALQGHDVTVFNHVTDRPSHPEANYRVQRYDTLPGMWRLGQHRSLVSWYLARKIGRLLDAFAPDFVSAHFGYPVAIWLARLRDAAPYSVTCHGPALNETPAGVRANYDVDKLLGDSMNRARGVVAISRHARRVLTDLGVRREKIVDIPNGVEVERFRRTVSGFDLRDRLGLPSDATVLLSVGRNAAEKAYPDAIEAFARVASGHPDLHYVILGRGSGRLGALADERGVAGRVHPCEGLHGDDLIAAYQQSDLFVLSSVKELCPLVVPEAMAAGLPLVVTDVSGSQDMVIDDVNGLVVPPGDVDGLATALERLASEETLRRRMGEASSERSGAYDWGVLSRRYLDLV